MSDINDIDVIDQAVYDTVHDFVDPHSGKKGSVALSKLVGMSPSSLQNKANRNEDYAHLHFREARILMLATQDFRMLHALAAEVHHAVIPLPSIQFPTNFDLAVAMSSWVKDIGETSAKIEASLKDRKLTQAELKEIETELTQDYEQGMALFDVLKGMAEPE